VGEPTQKNTKKTSQRFQYSILNIRRINTHWGKYRNGHILVIQRIGLNIFLMSAFIDMNKNRGFETQTKTHYRLLILLERRNIQK
jgi:hypothetical protein